MISIKNLSVKNFMSVGNATQGINFDRKDLTLVLGENLDLGGERWFMEVWDRVFTGCSPLLL